MRKLPEQCTALGLAMPMSENPCVAGATHSGPDKKWVTCARWVPGVVFKPGSSVLEPRGLGISHVIFAGKTSLLFEAHTLLCNILGPLWLPGSQVQLWDLAAAHEATGVSVSLEYMSWYFRDPGVIAYYSRQGDFGQCRALLRSENPSVLPPKPAGEGRKHNRFLPSGFFIFKTPATLFPNNTFLLPRANLNFCYLNQEPWLISWII